MMCYSLNVKYHGQRVNRNFWVVSKAKVPRTGMEVTCYEYLLFWHLLKRAYTTYQSAASCNMQWFKWHNRSCVDTTE